MNQALDEYHKYLIFYPAMGQTVDGFAPLRVKRVVRETADAVSLVLDVPEPFSQRFRYQPGQFLTVRVQVDGQEHRRCYSMSSSPVVAEDLRITVKRDPGGVVSNWLNDTAAVGAEIHASPPEGRFVLGESDCELVAFAGGSGITPVYSLIRSALAVTTRRVRLFYANRTRNSVIFANALAALAQQHPDRLVIHHHLDEDSGVVQPEEIEAFVADAGDAEFYLCGPREFMDTVEAVVRTTGVAPDRIHLERFDVVDASVAAATVTEEVTIRLDRRTTAVPYRAGNTVLQTARLAGLQPPSSCETGSCGTCMARLVEGSVRMINNDALTEEEVADGWVLTCQSMPITRTVKVVYE
jgi:3-ketosteroid 9alpha-monooxygenase subunit B